MKIIKNFSTYIGENIETPSEAPSNIPGAQSRMGETIYVDPTEVLNNYIRKFHLSKYL